MKDYNEPEEDMWHDVVFNREKVGNFSAITWFRAIRITDLYKAYERSSLGKISIVDSYFDKLLVKYIDDEGMRWLVEGNDPYADLI